MDRRDFFRSAGGAVAFLALPDARRRLVPTAAAATGGGGAPADGPGPATTAFMDGLWDESLGLIRFPFEEQPPPVRETAWYALGLLQRGGDGDTDRARRALETVISRQYVSPGALFHGSYARYGTDPPIPPAEAREFAEFDPNWRQFIGTALALAVERFGKQLGTLTADLEASIELAAAGERVDRVEPDYSNIALMHAWLLAYTGSKKEGEELARAIVRRYREANALDEYNSPTYDGVSLYGISLWREEPPSKLFARLGDELGRAIGGRRARLGAARPRTVPQGAGRPRRSRGHMGVDIVAVRGRHARRPHRRDGADRRRPGAPGDDPLGRRLGPCVGEWRHQDQHGRRRASARHHDRGSRSAVITIGVPGLDPAAVHDTEWQLPGLRVMVTCDLFPSVAPHATEEGVELEYPPTRLVLEVAAG